MPDFICNILKESLAFNRSIVQFPDQIGKDKAFCVHLCAQDVDDDFLFVCTVT